MYASSNEVLGTKTLRGDLPLCVILTALQVETQAVLAHLVELRTLTGKKRTIYECGRCLFGASECVVAVAEVGRGSYRAGTAVHNAMKDFDEVDLLIFVGVAGSLKEDIPIGSVIASTKAYNVHSNRYGEQVQARPTDVDADFGLVQLARKVAREENWISRVRNPVNHTLPTGAAYPGQMPPRAHTEALACADGVVSGDAGAVLPTIKQSYSDSCAVETEAYGTLFAATDENLAAIVVRGISDSVTDKSPEGDAIRQPVAAAHAAAFAVEMLASIVIGTASKPSSARIENSAGDGRAVDEEVAAKVASRNGDNDNRTSIVIAVEGDQAKLSEEKARQLVSALREGTGDQSIQLRSIESGSICLILDVSKKLADFSRFYSKIKSSVEGAGFQFIGLTSERAYRKTKLLREEILRASKEVMAWEKTLPNGEWIDRRELHELLQRITNTNSSTCVLTGPPGSGKSALVSKVAIDLVGMGVAVLAIKADQLPPNVDSSSGLNRHLGISIDVASAIRQLTRVSKVVLVIDQLDALAGYIDLKTDRLNVLLNLVKDLARTPNLHIVLTCRTFEQEHDVRLKALEAEAISLQLPSWSDISKVLKAHQIDADGWSEPAQSMLRFPVALKVFIENTKQSNESEIFSSYQTMLDRIWEQRLVSVPRNAGAVKLLTEMAGIMAEEETLWLPTVRFEHSQPDLRLLESLGFITFADDGKSVGFSHQTLFEHTLARTFARGDRGLAAYVLDKQQSLFIRPKVWAALSYLRDADMRAYERESSVLWATKNLQRHVRYLLIEFFGQCVDPTSSEIRWMTTAASDSVGRAVVLRSVIGNSSWFSVLAEPVLAEAMVDETLSGVALEVIGAAWGLADKRVVELVKRNWMTDRKWDNHVWHALHRAQSWDANLMQMVVTLLERTDFAPGSVNHLASVVAVSRLDLALSIVRAALDKMLRQKRNEIESMSVPRLEPDASLSDRMMWQMKYSNSSRLEKLIEGPGDWFDLGELAKADSQMYLRVLWPWYESIFGDLARDQTEGEASSYITDSSLATALRGDGESRREYTLIGALLEAVQDIAKVSPEGFRAWVSQVSSSSLMVVHRLIAYGYCAKPEEYSGDAIGYLLGDRRRLKLGSFADRFETTKLLIQAIAPYLRKAQVSMLEKRILDFRSFDTRKRTSAKDRRELQKFVRRDRLRLLSTLPSEMVSEKGKQTLLLEGRAVGVPPNRDVYVRGPRFIGSSMSMAEMQKAKDDDILRFLLELPDDTNWDRPGRFMEGGSIQASREFAEFARGHVQRAIAIIESLPTRSYERPVGYAIEAMASAEGSDHNLVPLIFGLVKKGFNGEEFRSAVAKATKKWVDSAKEMPEAIVDLLESWLRSPIQVDAQEGASEQAVETARTDQPQDTERHGRSVLWEPSGFMILPDGNFPILEAITAVLLKRSARNLDRWIEILTSHLATDEKPEVWRAMLPRLAYLGNGDRSKGETLLRAIFDKYPTLLHSSEAVMLLAYVRHWIGEATLRVWLELLGKSDNRDVRLAYGELIGLIGLTQPEMVWALEEVNRIIGSEHPGDDPQIGLAFSAANLWQERAARTSATEVLIALIRVGHRDLAAPVLSVFRKVDELYPDEPTVQLLRALRHAPEFVVGSDDTYLPERLQTLLPHEAELIGELTLALVEEWGPQLSTMSSTSTMAAPYLSDIALTLHRLGGVTRDVGVAIFEKLIEINAYGARETLSQLDGRLRKGIQRPIRRFRRNRR